MKGFIEVTTISNCKTLICVDKIACVIAEDEEFTFISLSYRECSKKRPVDSGYLIKESYAEVVEKIKAVVES